MMKILHVLAYGYPLMIGFTVPIGIWYLNSVLGGGWPYPLYYFLLMGLGGLITYIEMHRIVMDRMRNRR